MTVEREVIINEQACKGCGYCTKFCEKGCIRIPGDKYTAMGYLLPVFAEPEKCNLCGACAKLCPAFAIEVYAVKN